MKKFNPKDIKIIRFNDYLDLFNYGTSIREDIDEFIEKEISYNELIRRTYCKKTKMLLKYWKNKYGIRKLKNILRKIQYKFELKFSSEIEGKYCIIK